MNKNVVLEGSRVTLRPLSEGDVVLIQKWSADPELRKLIGETEPMSDSETKEFLDKVRGDETRLSEL